MYIHVYLLQEIGVPEAKHQRQKYLKTFTNPVMG